MKFHKDNMMDLSHETITIVSIKSKIPYNGFDIAMSKRIVLDEKLINSLLSKAYAGKIFIEESYNILSQRAINRRYELYLESTKEEEINLLREEDNNENN